MGGTRRTPLQTTELGDLVERVAQATEALRKQRSLLVAISGIDASGKGVLAARLAAALEKRGLGVALIGLDAWHRPQTMRLSHHNAAEHFYRHAFRWDELFDLLIDPLVQKRSIELETKLIEVAQDNFYTHAYKFRDIDAVLLEGTFLSKKEFRDRYDLAFWVECSFEAALARALRRNQEGLPEQQIIDDYERIYFPAQRIHLAEDNPKGSADLIYLNEERRVAKGH